MKSKWRMPHPATMFLLLTMAVVFLSWICDIYGLKVTLPQSGEDIRVQSLLSPVWEWETGKRKEKLSCG